VSKGIALSYRLEASEAAMDNDEAIQLLERELAAFCDESYDELVRRIQSESVA
jgi:hypothetical protein